MHSKGRDFTGTSYVQGSLVIRHTTTQGHHPHRGVSGFAFVPESHEQALLVLTTEESHPDANSPGFFVRSYISVLDREGRVLLEDQKFADIKYEGVDFVAPPPPHGVAG